MKEAQFKKDEKIALNDASVEAWAQKLGCETNDLWRAVLVVGPTVQNVFAYLQMNCKIKEDGEENV